jgi:hypothetical protein
MTGNENLETAQYKLNQRDTASIEEAKVYAIMAAAEELRMQNLIACSQRVFIRDAPDMIRQHFGEAALGAPEFDQAAHLAEFQGHLRQGLEEYFTEKHLPGTIFSDLDVGQVGVDGQLDLDTIAQFLAGYLVGIRG